MWSFSKLSWVIGSLLLLFAGSVFYPRWEKARDHGEAQLSWDAGGYYWYLPSAFVYHDLKKQRFKDSIIQRYQPIPVNDFQYGYKIDSSNYVIRYTMGTALLELPSFCIAHMIARPLGYPADGFSLPYQFMIWLGGVLFAIIGLWYLRKLLCFYYSDTVTGIAILLLVLGTNYLNYAAIDVGMTHSWLFSLYVFLLLNTHYYYETRKRKYALGAGLLIGLLGLTRPPELISALIPLFWGMENLRPATIKGRLRFFAREWKSFAVAALLCLLILFLQGIYWKYATGHWLIYTYRDQGFVWLSPYITHYAFNFQSGWLLYTPMMSFAIIGIFFFLKTGKNKVAILSLIIVNYYVVASWATWEYGGRAMVQNYPVLLFPLASLIKYTIEKRWRLIIIAPVLLIFIYFNVWWTYQAHRGTLIGSVPATRAYYFATVFRYNLPLEVQKLRDNEDLYVGKIMHPIPLYTNDSAKGTIVGDKQFSISLAPKDKLHHWLRAGAKFHINQKEWNVWYMTLFTLRLKKGDEVVQENYIRIQRLLSDGQTEYLTIDAKVKNKDYDKIEIQLRNENNGPLPCTIDSLTVITFD